MDTDKVIGFEICTIQEVGKYGNDICPLCYKDLMYLDPAGWYNCTTIGCDEVYGYACTRYYGGFWQDAYMYNNYYVFRGHMENGPYTAIYTLPYHTKVGPGKQGDILNRPEVMSIEDIKKALEVSNE